ncbi:diacylglycerol kinase family protein [uncultured Slackia sp.]|uniref:diacylglycerol/lipid kinase family protein n=1 Tax=uncultured Slackia sp. TaxID=665903 RepID=UPI0025DD3B65|nr:diacylglycerol kinase family protein [uncultured Slackia sp.]
MQNLGRVLVIANPAARNGEGKRAAEYVRSASATLSPKDFDIRVTAAPGDGTSIAAEAAEYDTVLTVGGDGVIHEVVGGLMRLPRDARPTLGVIPCGNGNDFARTLGMGLDWREALSKLVFAQPRKVDIGLCNDVPFMQTLSFGLDAAIALGTHERRARTGHSGTRLYLEEGASQLAFHRDAYEYECSFDGEEPQSGSMLLFAVQLGPTYDGGFKICPDANPSDGRFDICIARAPIGLAKAAFLFLRAKDGKHLRHAGDSLLTRQANRLRISFACPPPAQLDGELLEGSTFDIRTDPQALTVLFATERASV